MARVSSQSPSAPRPAPLSRPQTAVRSTCHHRPGLRDGVFRLQGPEPIPIREPDDDDDAPDTDDDEDDDDWDDDDDA